MHLGVISLQPQCQTFTCGPWPETPLLSALELHQEDFCCIQCPGNGLGTCWALLFNRISIKC